MVRNILGPASALDNRPAMGCCAPSCVAKPGVQSGVHLLCSMNGSGLTMLATQRDPSDPLLFQALVWWASFNYCIMDNGCSLPSAAARWTEHIREVDGATATLLTLPHFHPLGAASHNFCLSIQRCFTLSPVEATLL